MEPYEEREIDLKQLLLTVLARWQLILILALCGAAAGAAYSALQGTEPAPSQEASVPELTYREDEAYYETMDALYEQWIREAQEVLAEGMPEPLAEGRSAIEEADTALQLLARIETANTARGKLTAPEAPSAGGARSVIRYGVIGCVGGLFLGLFLLAMYYVLSNRILSADEMNRRYRLRALTVLPDERHTTGVSGTLQRIGADAVYHRMAGEERLQVAKANFSVYAPDIKEALLVGEMPVAEMEEIRKALSARIPEVQWSVAAHINENAASLEMLKNAENIILTAKVLSSKYTDLDRMMQTLHDWKKTVVGTVVTG